MSRNTTVKIPGYRIEKVRGEGAMATVYKAAHIRLQKTVALKVLHDFVAEDADYRERFLREARAAAKLNHRNVVRAYEAGEHEGLFWFAMEYVDGEDLGERLLHERKLGEEEALRIGIELTHALSAAEDHGMVHRDIKPENVLLSEDGDVKLADLGLAKVQGDGSLTAEGYTLGTVAFFSPEQCRGSKGLDIRSDLYALGALLYNLVSGELPYGSGKNPVLTMQRILEEPPPALEASAPLVSTVATLMSKDREARPASAADARALLEDTLEELLHGSATRPAASARRRRRRRPRSAGHTRTAGAGGGIPTGVLALVGGLGISIGIVAAFSGGNAPVDDEVSTGDERPTRRPTPPPKKPATPDATPTPDTTAPDAVKPDTPVPDATPKPDTPEPDTPEPDTTEPIAAPPNPELPAMQPAVPPPVSAPPLDLKRAFGAKSATRIQDPETGQEVVRLAYTWSNADQLRDWAFDDGQVSIDRGGLVFKVPARGAGDFALRAPLLLPVDVHVSVRVTTKGLGKHGVLWLTLGREPGQGLACFGGVSLYAIAGNAPTYLAGKKRPRASFAGKRRRVRVRFGADRVQGWLDGKPLFDHPRTGEAGPQRLALRLERGVAIDLRKVTIQGRLDPSWIQKVQGS